MAPWGGETHRHVLEDGTEVFHAHALPAAAEATDAESDAQAGARDHSHALTMLSPDGGSGGAEPAGETARVPHTHVLDDGTHVVHSHEVELVAVAAGEGGGAEAAEAAGPRVVEHQHRVGPSLATAAAEADVALVPRGP